MQIHVLDSETVDKIAAGEVVERPASVVKELVENAIDAGATAITVEAKDGGIEFLRVTDNGSGIEKGQLRTAFLRHATSKINTIEDLMQVGSLGFRGEALSSIAAVSRVELITKTKDTLTGVRLVLEGAVEKAFEEIGAPEGTTFIMRNLFFNTPVRRKFLKQPATEGGYIADLMEHLALSRPDISFKFVLGSQTRFHTSGNGDLREAVYRIYGREVASSLIPIQTEENGICLEGYLGKPVVVRSNRNFEIYYINGRFVRSSIIAKAVEEGYKEYLMQHKFPLCILHISMDMGMVDVNVHPAKMDVRFGDNILFVQCVSKMIRNTLKQQEMIPEAPLTDGREAGKALKQSRAEAVKVRTPEPFELRRESSFRVMEDAKYQADILPKKDFQNHPVWSRVKSSGGDTSMEKEISCENKVPAPEEEPFFVEETAPAVDNADSSMDSSVDTASVYVGTAPVPADNSTASLDGSHMSTDNSSSPMSTERMVVQEKMENASQMNLFEEKILTVENRMRYRIIGQVFDTYWLIQYEDKMLMIDQHAAHEKVKYERLIKQYREKTVTSQNLMPPVIISLSGQEEAVLKEHWDSFLTLGFEVEAFGGTEYALRSVPVDLYGCGEREMFLEVLDELGEGKGYGSIRVIEEKIASMSCKAAVKGNNRLSVAEAEKLIDELLTLDNPYNCPHGRPTIVTISKTEMEKKFKRIV